MRYGSTFRSSVAGTVLLGAAVLGAAGLASAEPPQAGADAPEMVRKFAVDAPVYGLAFSADGKTLVVTGKGGVWLVDPARDRMRGRPTGAVIERPEEGWYSTDRYFDCPALSPDGRTLAAAEYDWSADPKESGAFGRLWLWEMRTGQVKVKKKLEDIVAALAFSPDGKRVAFGDTWGGLGIVDLAAGQMWRERSKRMTGAAVSAVCFSPDGKLVAVADDPEEARAYTSMGGVGMVHVPMPGGDGTIRLRDPATKKTVGELTDKDSQGIQGAAFAADGKSIAAVSEDGRVRVWEVASGKLLRWFRIEKRPMWHAAVAFSAGADRVAVQRAWDTGATVWDVQTGRRLATLPQEGGDADVIAISADGRLLATADVDDRQGRVTVWRVGGSDRK